MFSNDLIFLCKHLHAHTLAFMNLRLSASNSLRGDVRGVGAWAENSSQPGQPGVPPSLHLSDHLSPCGLWVPHSPILHVQAGIPNANQ